MGVVNGGGDTGGGVSDIVVPFSLISFFPLFLFLLFFSGCSNKWRKTMVPGWWTWKEPMPITEVAT